MLRRVVSLTFVLALVAAACGDDTASETDGEVEVPDVVGESADFARGVLEASGLVADPIEVEVPGAEPGTVIEQVPAGGATAASGSTVVLKVASAGDTADETTSTTIADAGDSTTTTTAGGGATTTAAPTTTSGTTTTTAATTTTTAAQTAPDDGGDGSTGSSPEHTVTVVAENNNPDAVVFNGAISVPGDRGDGIQIRVDNLFQGSNQDQADVQVTIICTPGGPAVRQAPAGYSGGSPCDASYVTSFSAGYQSYLKTYFIFVPGTVEGYFEYTLTVVAVRH